MIDGKLIAPNPIQATLPVQINRQVYRGYFRRGTVNGTAAFTGVSFVQSSKGWYVRLSRNGKSKHPGQSLANMPTGFNYDCGTAVKVPGRGITLESLLDKRWNWIKEVYNLDGEGPAQ